MEQFIVLGQIPGTHLQLTYGWFLALLLASFAFGAYKLYRTRWQKQVGDVQRHFDVISLRNLDQA